MEMEMTMGRTFAASPRRVLVAALLLGPGLLGSGLLLSGCPEDNPDYCSSDQQCKDPSREGHDPARPHCHGEGNFCYEGCASHQDCADSSRSWYRADRPFCDPVTSDCVAAPAHDGGQDGDGPPRDAVFEAGRDAGVDVDAPLTKLENGESCQSETWCKSGLCVDKVCCDKICTGLCVACDVAGSKGTCTTIPSSAGPQAECPGDSACGNGSCENGACIFPKAGKPCGASSCSGGQQTTPTCDATS